MATQAALLDEMAAVMPDVRFGSKGQVLTDGERAELQRERAQEWITFGHTSAETVGEWIAAGIYEPDIAAHAETLGYKPGDPWVDDLANDPDWDPAKHEGMKRKRPNFIQSRLNRATARKDWKRYQRTAETV